MVEKTDKPEPKEARKAPEKDKGPMSDYEDKLGPIPLSRFENDIEFDDNVDTGPDSTYAAVMARIGKGGGGPDRK